MFDIVRRWFDLDSAVRGSLSQVALRTAWIKEVRPGLASSVLLGLSAAFEAIAVRLQKGLHGLEADASKQFDPGDHQPGAPGDNVRSERQLLPSRELRDPLDQEFQVGLDRPKSVPLGFGLPVSAMRSILPA